MKRPGHALRLVAAAVQGRLPDPGEWPAVIETANRGWLVPKIYVALRRSGALREAPEAVQNYLGLLHERNLERNRRLLAQLVEALKVWNSHGARPVLLKGAIHLFEAPEEELGARMLSDLDIDVAPGDVLASRPAFESLGYRFTENDKVMERESDPAVIDLHHEPNSRSAPYLRGDMRLRCRDVERDGAIAKVPSPTLRATHLIVHDLLKDGDYWRFRIDLRHLQDLAELACSSDGIDWRAVAEALCDERGRRALELQLAALRDIFEVEVPHDLPRRRATDRHHWARLMGSERGPAATVIRFVGDVSWGLRRIAEGRRPESPAALAHHAVRLFSPATRGSKV